MTSFYIDSYPIHRWAIYNKEGIRISDVYTLKSQAEEAFPRVIKNPKRYMKKDAYRKIVYEILSIKDQAIDMGYEWPKNGTTKNLQHALDKNPRKLEGILKEIKEYIEEHKDG